MAQVTVRIPTPLRTYTGGADEVRVEAHTVAEALQALEQRHEGVLRYVLADNDELRPFVNVFVGDREVRALGGLDATLEAGSVITVLPAIAGGSAVPGRSR